jgi:predicted RNase H-like nuclease (RuvC/YqgF family)
MMQFITNFEAKDLIFYKKAIREYRKTFAAHVFNIEVYAEDVYGNEIDNCLSLYCSVDFGSLSDFWNILRAIKNSSKNKENDFSDTPYFEELKELDKLRADKERQEERALNNVIAHKNEIKALKEELESVYTSFRETNKVLARACVEKNLEILKLKAEISDLKWRINQ